MQTEKRFERTCYTDERTWIYQNILFKKETYYCYSENEKQDAIKKLGKTAEITRFKGLGEISPAEFKHFIGKSIRLDPVMLRQDVSLEKILDFYMGKNTPDRQSFIIDNLRYDEILEVL